MGWTKEDLRQALQEDFIEEWDAWGAGHRNDDMVDSMCICFALDEEWTEMWAKHVDNFKNRYDIMYGRTIDGEFVEGGKMYFDKFLKEHYERIKDWLDVKELVGYERGDADIMTFCINH